MDKPNTVYVTFIATTADRIWDLLLDTDSSTSWYFGHRMEVGAAVGDPYRLLLPDGSLLVDGEVLIIEPGRRLRVSWTLPDMPIAPIDNEVDFFTEDLGIGVIRLVVQEWFYEPIPEKWVETGREAWSLMLASVKTLLETGKPLPRVKMEPPE